MLWNEVIDRARVVVPRIVSNTRTSSGGSIVGGHVVNVLNARDAPSIAASTRWLAQQPAHAERPLFVAIGVARLAIAFGDAHAFARAADAAERALVGLSA